MFKIEIRNYSIISILDICEDLPYYDAPARYIRYKTIEEGIKRIMLSYEDRVTITEVKEEK